MAKNHEQRVIQSFGPKFRIDVNSTLMGQKGTNVYLLYAVTDDNSTQFQALDESGRFMLHNEKDIEIVAGPKLKGDVGIDIKTLKGNIDADVVSVSGKCDGQVSGDVISIKSTGKITGEVFYENISIEEGAVVEAQIGKRKNKN